MARMQNSAVLRIITIKSSQFINWFLRLFRSNASKTLRFLHSGWSSSFFFEFVIGEMGVYGWSDFGWYFADIVVYPHCAFNELQKRDEMEDSEYTNFKCTC